MAATLFRAAVPTPTSLVYAPPYPGMARRFENSTVTTSARGPDCSVRSQVYHRWKSWSLTSILDLLQSFNGFKTCSSTGDYGSCLAGTNAASICNCNNGMQYLDCVSAAIATSSCVGAVGISGRHSETTRSAHNSLTLVRRLGRLPTQLVPVLLSYTPKLGHDFASPAVNLPDRQIPNEPLH
jgi:hypothetical protein